MNDSDTNDTKGQRFIFGAQMPEGGFAVLAHATLEPAGNDRCLIVAGTTTPYVPATIAADLLAVLDAMKKSITATRDHQEPGMESLDRNDYLPKEET
jgi:hypothetical protein